MTQAFIETSNLVKRFGTFTAVGGISLTVNKGEVLGFLGPNGAGKSTTMKMITGFLVPSEGSVRVCGRDVVEETVLAQEMIGYLPEGAPAYGDMTPRQYLSFIAEVRGARGEAVEPMVMRAVERTQLSGVLDQPIETLSKGFKRRVGLAQAIIHEPPVLIMDEPTDGLDPNQKHAVRDLIRTMAQDKAIIVSTHILEEVDAICSRAVIIDQGKIVADGTPAELTARSRYHNAVTIEMKSENSGGVEADLKAVEGVGAVDHQGLEEGFVRFTAFPKDADLRIVEAIAKLAGAKEWDVRALYAENGRLDEVFRTLTTSDAGHKQEAAAPTGDAA